MGEKIAYSKSSTKLNIKVSSKNVNCGKTALRFESRTMLPQARGF